jgi:4-aminobutyrate aminotransferase/(S)-3-amino-2-methylpropionate transaminase
MFACQHEDLVPDLIVTAKGIAGGLPLSAVTGRVELMDAVHPGGLGGTYGGNPLACAAALAVFDIIADDQLVERARQVESLVRKRLEALRRHDNRVGDIRGRGAMVAVELVHAGTINANPALAKVVAAQAHQQGVIVLTCGTNGNVLRFLPPLAISDAELDEAFDVLDLVFRANSDVR